MTRIFKYPRYQARPGRAQGMGAFSDFAADVAKRNAVKLESCSLLGHWRAGKRGELAEQVEPVAQP